MGVASRQMVANSSAVIVIDAEGNVIVGTHTIATMAWGEGLFVGGVPLSTAGPTAFDDAGKARSRVRVDGLSNTIVMKDGKVRAALAVYGTGLHLADAEILDAVIARGLDAEAAVLEPRVGYFQFDIEKGGIDYARNAVDPRFDAALLCSVKQRGFFLDRAMPGFPPGVVDTGFPTLVTMAPGAIHGMTPERMKGVAAGD